MKKLLFLLIVIALSCTKQTDCYQCNINAVNLLTNDISIITSFEICDPAQDDIDNLTHVIIMDSILYVTRCKQ
jgi:hypothetical protein